MSTENRAVATAVVRNGAHWCKTVKYHKPGLLRECSHLLVIERSQFRPEGFFQVKLPQHRLAVKLLILYEKQLPPWLLQGTFLERVGRGCLCLLLEAGWKDQPHHHERQQYFSTEMTEIPRHRSPVGQGGSASIQYQPWLVLILLQPNSDPLLCL